MLLELNSETQVRREWPRWLSYRIGLLPLPMFILLFGAVAALTDAHALTGDVSVMIATLAAGGFLCAWLGGLIPFLRYLGAPAITAAFLPSYLVYRHWLPANLVETVTSFTKGTNFIYLYITAIIVGSILGMNRKLLLQPPSNILPLPASPNVAPIALKNDQLCAAALFGISHYLLGILSHSLLEFPPPDTMLVLAVLLKVSNLLPLLVDQMVAAVGYFFAVIVTYPLLFAVAVALTPWKSVKEALHAANLAVILVVLTLVVTGFFIGRWIHLYPVKTAIVNACHTGAGGTGDVAILTAANRLELMPFAQIATRIGGAITVTLTLLILRFLTHGK